MVGNITVSSHEVDLRKKPATVFPIPEDATSITIGDLHGNAMKLINFLLAYGLISLDEEQYQTLFKIYNKPTKDLASSDIISFDNIIQRHLTVNRSTLVVRLIGDELADRGANDYFTLSVLHRLQADGKVKIETIASNHGMEFMKAYFHGQLAKEAYFATETILGEAEQGSEKGKKVLAQRQSAFNLRHCLNEKMIDFSRLSELVEEHVETLCLLSYDFSESHGLTLYSHAPIDTRNIANLCQVFNLTEHYEKKKRPRS